MVWTTINVELTREEIAKLYRFCADHLITVDELTEEFMRWTIDNPVKAKQWLEKTMNQETEHEKVSEHA